MKRLYILLIISILTICACSKRNIHVDSESVESLSESIIHIEDETKPIQNETEQAKEALNMDERKEIDGKIRSYLSGEMKPVEIANRRPLAVMMSNDKAALPQYGINSAEVVYEAMVEGVMNRYMALIEDFDELDRIGTVRSARTYYIYFAKEWEAIFAHMGQSTFAKPYLKYVDDINGVEGKGGAGFYRTKDRKMPHNAYTSGDRVKNISEKLSYSFAYPTDYKGHFKFYFPEDDVDINNGVDSYKLYPGYPYSKPWFEYDENKRVYYRYQYSGKHMGDKEQLYAKNIIFQYSPTAHYATTDYLNINIHEKTYGYYFTNGKGIKIIIEKKDELSPTKYYDLEGNEIRFNCGKTWVCVIDSAKYKNSEIYDKDGNRQFND